MANGYHHYDECVLCLGGDICKDSTAHPDFDFSEHDMSGGHSDGANIGEFLLLLMGIMLGAPVLVYLCT